MLNNLTQKMGSSYKPYLAKMQQLEASRINFLKYSIEKLTKHFQQIGQKITSTGLLLHDYSQFITSETDIKCFIKATKSDFYLDTKVTAEVYTPSTDL